MLLICEAEFNSGASISLMLIYKSKYKKVGVLVPIRITKSNVSSVGPASSEKNRFLFCFSLTKDQRSKR